MVMGQISDRELHEECGVFGVFGVKDAASLTYYGLHALHPRWSVSYDGRFRALTGEGAIVLDDSDMNVQKCPATPAADSLAQNFRALVQQYYTHIEKKNYTAND